MTDKAYRSIDSAISGIICGAIICAMLQIMMGA